MSLTPRLVIYFVWYTGESEEQVTDDQGSEWAYIQAMVSDMMTFCSYV